MTAKLSCALLTTRSVATADADCATPRARSSDGSAIVAIVQINDAVNSKSISVKPDSLVVVTLSASADMAHLDTFRHFCQFSTMESSGVGRIRRSTVSSSSAVSALYRHPASPALAGLQGIRHEKPGQVPVF